MNKRRHSIGAMRLQPLAMAVSMAFLAAGNAAAFEIETGNPDVSVRWDNTVRYNVATRVGERDSRIANNQLFDEGDFSFDKGDLVANRLDLLTELDVVYKKNFGFRVSAAGWADAAYGSASKANPALPAITNSYVNRQFSNYTKRFYHGPSGEILDAFLFAGIDAGEVPVKMKLGRHTVFWGESLFLGGALHSVSYAQNPLDLQKGSATPGVEAKELFRPLNQLSAQAQLTNDLSVSGQYFLEWDAYRYPEGGTYLGPADFGFNGPDRVFAGPPLNVVTRANALEPKNSGEFGLSARWSPEALDGTVGFYYRQFADKLPQPLITQIAPTPQYRLIYADKVDLFGVSLAKNIGGVSVGSELSYRRNTPLSPRLLGPAPGIPAQGETNGPRGDTFHGLINALGTIGRTPLFDAASWSGELTWAHWDKVRTGASLFNAEGFFCTVNVPGVGARPGDRRDGCATKNFFGMALAFTPTWYQVIPGVDLSAPMAYSRGLKGNAPTIFGGNEDNGNFSLGLGADIHQKYRVDLKYVGYFGRLNTYGTNTVVSQNGFSSVLQDRDFVSLTLKTTF
ncbi:DUF1302 domain-containing protein [Noviherbaspirillum sedimenti]|uniref:DUF1302 domain-containing protein n=1 Tax=Noviherbaspirillum sedimenti TaxID=2320865 RepID=A0A3A3G5A5_9BURK|nr:DUF1302 domain-containing protein [Noviherbaspirillum sedimenti]RJG03004.1 DUF1302 domain-containing protein [Noviherbaspirillum sedimenti]